MPRIGEPKSLAGQFAAMKADYRAEFGGMRDSRFRRKRPGVTSIGVPADAHAANEAAFTRMREYVRAMVNDDGVAKTILTRAADNIVGDGFRYEPQTGDSKLDADLKDAWEAWSENPRQCDTAGVMTFAQMEWQVDFSEKMDGDIFVVPVTDEEDEQYGSLQLIEAHRCATPSTRKGRDNVVLGVELSPTRAPRKYFFRKEDRPASGYQKLDDFHEIAALDEEGFPQVWHVHSPFRATQTRGVTAFHPILDRAGMFEDIDFALLVKEQSAAFLAWEERTQPGVPESDNQLGARHNEIQPDGTSITYEEIAAGSIRRTSAGKELHMLAPTIASAETMNHLRFAMQVLTMNLGLPLCVVTLDPSDTNFSGQRFAFDQAKRGFVRVQKWRKGQFHRNAAIFFVRRFIRADRFARTTLKKLGERVYRHYWHPAAWPYIQPMHDAQANALRLQTGQISLRDLHAENGGDFRQFARDNVDDISYWWGLAAKAFLSFKEQFPDLAKQLTIHDFYYRDFYRGGQIIDTAEKPNDGSSTQQTKDEAAAR